MWEWVAEYKKVNSNAISGGWFISPLEYVWAESKPLIDNVFSKPAVKSELFDRLVAVELYKATMNIPFRSSIMVSGYMQQNISKSFGLEIENGLMHFYQQDWLSAISQWLYILEGYSRILFKVKNSGSSDPERWKIPTVPEETQNDLIKTLAHSVGDFFSDVVYKPTNKYNSDSINRHLILHGNAANNKIYNQKNALLLLFSLDALLFIEMATNDVYPGCLEEFEGDKKRKEAREFLYLSLMQYRFSDISILKSVMLEEHV